MADNKFEKDQRLLSAEDFGFLKIDSKVYRTKFFRAFYKNSISPQKKTRIGFSISRKVGNSYLRNRLKRIMREQFRKGPYKNMGLDVMISIAPSFGAFYLEEEETAEFELLNNTELLFSYLMKRENHKL